MFCGSGLKVSIAGVQFFSACVVSFIEMHVIGSSTGLPTMLFMDITINL